MGDDFQNSDLAGVEADLRQEAQAFSYPATPDIAGRERRRLERQGAARLHKRARARLAWALAAVLLLASLMLVRPVRAQMLEWLRIGAVRIFLIPQPTPSVTVAPKTLQDLAGETSLPEAAAHAPFTLMAPAYPADLGPPQHVYDQTVMDSRVVIFVWTKPEHPEEVRLVLYQIDGGDAFQKQLMQEMEGTTVNGDFAMWVVGPYLLTNTNGNVVERRIVTGHTLIWTANGLTYRLETDQSLEEARKTAESLAAVQP